MEPSYIQSTKVFFDGRIKKVSQVKDNLFSFQTVSYPQFQNQCILKVLYRYSFVYENQKGCHLRASTDIRVKGQSIGRCDEVSLKGLETASTHFRRGSSRSGGLLMVSQREFVEFVYQSKQKTKLINLIQFTLQVLTFINVLLLILFRIERGCNRLILQSFPLIMK